MTIALETQPSVVPTEEENRQETALHHNTLPVEMHMKNTVPGKMYLCGPSPQAELKTHFKF